VPNERQTRCATEAIGLVQNRSNMLDFDLKRYETGRGAQRSGLERQELLIEARDLNGAKRSDSLPWRSAKKMRW